MCHVNRQRPFFLCVCCFFWGPMCECDSVLLSNLLLLLLLLSTSHACVNNIDNFRLALREATTLHHEFFRVAVCVEWKNEFATQLSLFPQVSVFSVDDNQLHYTLRRKRILVSFTTHSDRKRRFGPMLRSIIGQSIAPDEIRLYSGLSRAEFDTAEVQSLLAHPTVSLRFVDDKWRSFKKLLPLLSEEWGRNNTYVLVVDDDRIYRPHLLFDLLQTHARVGGIVTEMGRQITESAAYIQWPTNGFDANFPFRTVIMGFQGFLLRADVFKHTSVLSLQNAQMLTPSSDDLWWTTHAVIESIRVTQRFSDSRVDKAWNANNIPMPQNTSLFGENLVYKDKWWANLIHYAQAHYQIDLVGKARQRVPSAAALLES